MRHETAEGSPGIAVASHVLTTNWPLLGAFVDSLGNWILTRVQVEVPASAAFFPAISKILTVISGSFKVFYLKAKARI